MTKATKALFRIGELVRITKVPLSTLRHWRDKELIKEVAVTDGGDHLFDEGTVASVRKILILQRRRHMTIAQIKEHRNREH